MGLLFRKKKTFSISGRYILTAMDLLNEDYEQAFLSLIQSAVSSNSIRIGKEGGKKK